MTRALPFWMYQDPSIVCDQQEAWRVNQSKRQQPTAMTINDLFSEAPVTKDESDQLEDILLTWYYWPRAHRPQLGHSRVSPGFKHADSSDVYDDADDQDAKVNRYIAEQVDVCLSTLPVEQRAAVGIHTANRAAGNAIYRNPRMSSEQQHIAYQAAKDTLLPMLRKRDLIAAKAA